MRKFFAIVLMMVSFSASAIDSRDIEKAGFDKLPASQQAQIIAQVEQATNNGNAVPATANTILDVGERFVQMGSNLGKGLGQAAKEVGVAANEFVKTPVGT